MVSVKLSSTSVWQDQAWALLAFLYRFSPINAKRIRSGNHSENIFGTKKTFSTISSRISQQTFLKFNGKEL